MSTESLLTLNVNGTGEKNIIYKGNTMSSLDQDAGHLQQNAVYEFVYDATLDSYILIGDIDTNTKYNVATTTSSGLMSYSDKDKLDGIESGAQVNVNADWSATEGNAQILNKPSIPSKTSDLTNDSGFINTVDDALSSTSENPVQNKVINTEIGGLKYLVGDTPVSNQITSAINEIDYPVDSVNGKTGTIILTASDVGALPADTTIPSIDGLATETYVNNKVAGLVNSAPETLDTLNELAAALGNDPNFATTVANQIGNKVDKVEGKGLSTNDYTNSEKSKLAGIETGANKTTIDSTLSVSGNAADAKATGDAISDLSTLVGDTEVSTQIANAIAAKADKTELPQVVSAESNDGVAFTATVPGVTELYNGLSLIIIPATKSTSTTPTLNINGLGEKPIKRRLSSIYTSLQPGYSAGWLAASLPFRLIYDATTRSSSTETGVWVVEGANKPSGADVSGAVPQAKADADGNVIVDTYATIAMLQSMLPKVTTVTLGTVWNGSASPYYQDVTLSCCTETSIVDLQPTPTQLAEWQDNGWAFTTQSGNGTFRIYVAGGLPSGDAITLQVKCQEVTVV